MKSLIVNSNDEGQRLDKFLQKYLKNVPQSIIYKYIRKKRIKVNGKRAEISYKLCKNDFIELYINDEFFEKKDENNAFLFINPNLSIIYEDENIMLVDKKPGMSVHSDEKEKVNTLISHIKAYLYKKGEFDPQNENSFSPSLCNRIDRNTGGIVIAAKNAKTLRIINEKIKNKEIQKFYLLIAHGILAEKSGVLKGYLIKNKEQNRVYIYDTPQKNARYCETKYKVLKENNNLSLIEAELVTGRTHQIRAQFSYAKSPLLGDGKYGTNAQNKPYNNKYQALYSYKVIFNFKTDAGHLNYLKDKEFKVESIDFLKDFK